MIDGILPPRRPQQSGNEGVRPPGTNNDMQEQPSPEPVMPSFILPDAFAEAEAPDDQDSHSGQGGGKQNKLSVFLRHLRNLNKRTVILIVVAFVLIIGGGVGAFLYFRKPAPAPAVEVVDEVEVIEEVEPPKPTTAPSPLTGIQVSPEQAKEPIVGVMIENSPDARPQSGLKDAGVVFEAIAEGGITRFLALYQESQPDYIGPVRSVRPYYLDWLQGFDAAIAHVGGSPEALQKIRDDGVKDLDQFANSGSYYRISARYAPHNMYSGVNDLNALSKAKGWTTSNYVGFPRKEDSPVTAQQITNIDFTISSYLYNVHFGYDAASNSYLRKMAGVAHLDEKSGAQIQPKVVVGLVVPWSKHADGTHSVYGTIGSGKAVIFQDGGVTLGTWSKSSAKDPLKIGDANGSPLAMNAGQTWVTVVGTEGSIAYQ